MSENPKAANFGDLYINLEKNFDIDCQLINFDETKHNPKGNRYQDCVLSDGQEQQKVKIWEGRNGIPLEEKNLNQWLTFNLSARAGTGKWKDNKYIGGFWDSSAAVIDSSQNTQQGVQQPAQATKAPQPTPQGVQMRMPDTYAYPVTPETQERMARCAAGEAASRVVAAMIKRQTEPVTKKATIKTLLDIGDTLSQWMVHGINVANVPNPHPDIQTKKCVQCGALDETQCSCVPW